MVLQVARLPAGPSPLRTMKSGGSGEVVFFFARSRRFLGMAESAMPFDGATGIEVARPDDFEMVHHDYSITGRIKTSGGGNSLCQDRARRQLGSPTAKPNVRPRRKARLRHRLGGGSLFARAGRRRSLA